MLKNTRVDVKFKLATLWLTIFLLFIYGDLFSMWIPTRLNDLLNGSMGIGDTSPEKLLGVSIFITIYAVMPLMNLMLAPKISRITNIVIAIFLIIVWGLILTQSSFSSMWNFYIYLAIVEMVLALIVIYIAWNWPKVEH